jgi:endonuclease/exonuclease/phosphatase family metal-dependent hydrolase
MQTRRWTRTLPLLCLLGYPEVRSAQDELVVMSYNIRYGTANDGDNRWELRRPHMIALIKAHNPDILGVQEALHFQIDELLAALPNYRMVGVGRSDGRSPSLSRQLNHTILQVRTAIHTV